MSDRQSRLTELRNELTARLERYESHQQRTDGPLSKQFDEQSLTIQTDEVVDSLEQNSRAELAAVNHALMRIKNGDGDACETCGEPIDPKRLATIPFATQCVKCAE